MGLELNRLVLEEYSSSIEINGLYQRRIQGHHKFTLETHYLEGGKEIQVYLYREHSRMKEFIEKRNEHNLVSVRTTSIQGDYSQARVYINSEPFMLLMTEGTEINITEYNIKDDLQDCPKGKIAILLDFKFTHKIDNNKFIADLKSYWTKGE